MYNYTRAFSIETYLHIIIISYIELFLELNNII